RFPRSENVLAAAVKQWHTPKIAQVHLERYSPENSHEHWNTEPRLGRRPALGRGVAAAFVAGADRGRRTARRPPQFADARSGRHDAASEGRSPRARRRGEDRAEPCEDGTPGERPGRCAAADRG